MREYINNEGPGDLTAGELYDYLAKIVCREIKNRERQIDSQEEYEELVDEIFSEVEDLASAIKEQGEGHPKTPATDEVRRRLNALQ